MGLSLVRAVDGPFSASGGSLPTCVEKVEFSHGARERGTSIAVDERCSRRGGACLMCGGGLGFIADDATWQKSEHVWRKAST